MKRNLCEKKKNIAKVQLAKAGGVAL
jgi:hypothetical protein